jgi:hypothetical protein
VFCRAAELGLRGTELPAELQDKAVIMRTLEAIRSVAAEKLGLVRSRADATRESPGLPKIGIVSAPQGYRLIGGNELPSDKVDLVARLVTMQTPHRAYMGAGGICTGVAALVEGSLVHEASMASRPKAFVVRIGHPTGVMEITLKATNTAQGLHVKSATVARTARLIMDGRVYIGGSVLSGAGL